MEKTITYKGSQFIVTDAGEVLNRKAYLNKALGYMMVAFYSKETGRQMSLYVHRLVALAFCNPPGSWEKLQVDHINGDRTDNKAENLRWVTRKDNNSTELARKRKSENTRHSNRKNQIIKAVDKNTGAVSYFSNARKAALGLRCSHVLIHNVLNPKYYSKSAKGHLLSYISKEQYEKEMNQCDVFKTLNDHH